MSIRLPTSPTDTKAPEVASKPNPNWICPFGADAVDDAVKLAMAGESLELLPHLLDGSIPRVDHVVRAIPSGELELVVGASQGNHDRAGTQ